MSAPLVSVIIPAYNAAATIGEALLSALDQTYRPLEIIVIDDGSTDATADIVQQRFGEQVKLLREPHCGRGSARNTALLAAKGELIQFLDADDLLEPGKVRAQVAYLVDHPGIDVVYGDIECFAADDPSFRWPYKPAEKPEGVVLSSMIEDGFLLTLSALVRAKQCAEVGGFDPQLRSNEDWDLWVRIAATGARFGRYPRDGFVGYYRINRGAPADAVHEDAGVRVLEKLQRSLTADEARRLRVRRAIGRWRFGYGRALLRSGGPRGNAVFAMARALIEDPRSWDYKLAWIVLGGILGAKHASGIIEALQSRATRDPATPRDLADGQPSKNHL